MEFRWQADRLYLRRWRLADWALNLDDAVVSVDERANRTSEPSVIVSGYHEDFPPAWSPDGKWTAYHSHRSAKPVPDYSSPGSTDDIYLRRADDIQAPEIRLTDFGWETGPAYWSPDGKNLLFHSWQHGGKPEIEKLFVITLDTQSGSALKTDMLHLAQEIRSPVWSACRQTAKRSPSRMIAVGTSARCGLFVPMDRTHSIFSIILEPRTTGLIGPMMGRRSSLRGWQVTAYSLFRSNVLGASPSLSHTIPEI